MTWFQKLSKADKIKVSIISVALPSACFMAFTMYSDYSSGSSNSKHQKIEPSQPKEIQALSETNLSAQVSAITPTKDLNESRGIEENIDHLFVSIYSDRAAKQQSNAKSEAVPSQSTPPPGLPPVLQPRSQIQIPMQPPVAFPVMASPLPQTTMQKVDIYGIACSSGVCSASTNVGVLKEKSLISSDETVQSVSMSGVRTNKRTITY